MATIVINVTIDSDVDTSDTLALHESLHEVAEACAGLMTNETLVTSTILADDERLLVEQV
jgi:hypothetical protein